MGTYIRAAFNPPLTAALGWSARTGTVSHRTLVVVGNGFVLLPWGFCGCVAFFYPQHYILHSQHYQDILQYAGTVKGVKVASLSQSTVSCETNRICQALLCVAKQSKAYLTLPYLGRTLLVLPRHTEACSRRFGVQRWWWWCWSCLLAALLQKPPSTHVLSLLVMSVTGGDSLWRFVCLQSVCCIVWAFVVWCSVCMLVALCS